LARASSWDRFDALVQHALAFGYDQKQGGLYKFGFDDRPAVVKDKVWWAQAEMLAALTESVGRRPSPAYASALEQLLTFLATYQIDPDDGIWLDTVAANGLPRLTRKSHNGKAAFHELRATVMFVETFGAGCGG
jgi:cellobiose epimerase